jgi:hypothetical protein
LRGHERGTDAPPVLVIPFLRIEKVQLVADDRTTKRSAKVMAFELVLLLSRLLEEIIGLVQRIVSPRIERAPMEPVGSGAGDDVDLCTAGLAELRPVAVSQDLEFLDDVDRRRHRIMGVAADVVVVDAL